MSIRFDEVHKSFGPKKRILQGVSFEVKTGEILFILGRSGVGKSVTLKHIVGVLKPDRGAVWVDGQDVTKLDELEMADIRRKCGMVFQHPALLDSLTVYENVSFGLRTPQYTQSLQRPLTEAEIRKIVLEKLSLVQLPSKVLERYPTEISYGMQKRVSLARTIAPGPDYLLFDEPTTGLDPITTNAVNELIFRLSRELKVTSIVVSHDMNCALKIADRILVLEGGNILFLGDVQETVRTKEPLIREFLAETLELLTPEERSRYGLGEKGAKK
ncbi:MAG: ATP-binding cassette domain-containing protein [Bdellovibrionales bacterium]|nr:ATP-binding cassette domain-containing protein [Bdellovibrionales bacterium]